MKKAVILSYSRTSESARLLADYLEGRFTYYGTDLTHNEVLINWGAGMSDVSWQEGWLNKPQAIRRAVDKLLTFKFLEDHGVSHPIWTHDPDRVRQWLQIGKIVLARQTASGTGGEGISILNNPRQPIPTAEFYSQHIEHDDEYRIHVFQGQIINIGKKFAYSDDANSLVRNWGSWRFNNPDSAPFTCIRAGVDAVNALSLDFGAVDIGYKRNQEQAYVFEVNTAPGTGHNTITRYAAAFRAYLRG